MVIGTSMSKISSVSTQTYINTLNSAILKAKKDNVLKTEITKIERALPTKHMYGKARRLYTCVLYNGKLENRRLDHLIAKLIKNGYIKRTGSNGGKVSDVLFYDSFDNPFRKSKITAIKLSAKSDGRNHNRSRSRVIDFSLDEKGKDLEKQLKKQNYKCRFTGLPLSFAPYKNPGSVKASLDRIDSNKGYVKGNIQWVASVVNIMKQSLTDAEFISWCKLISQHSHRAK